MFKGVRELVWPSKDEATYVNFAGERWEMIWVEE